MNFWAGKPDVYDFRIDFECEASCKDLQKFCLDWESSWILVSARPQGAEAQFASELAEMGPEGVDIIVGGMTFTLQEYPCQDFRPTKKFLN